MVQAAVTKLEFRKAEALFARAAAAGCARLTAAIPTRSKRAPNGSIPAGRNVSAQPDEPLGSNGAKLPSN